MKILLALLACLSSSAFIVPPAPARGLATARLQAALSESTRRDDKERYFLRGGVAEEKRAIQQVLVGMLMNPTSIDVNNFLCAEEKGTGALIGFGQVNVCVYMFVFSSCAESCASIICRPITPVTASAAFCSAAVPDMYTRRRYSVLSLYYTAVASKRVSIRLGQPHVSAHCIQQTRNAPLSYRTWCT